jgi:hypothetical protein
MNLKEVLDVFWSKNPTDPEYWFDKPLNYTYHATERCVSRGIQQLDFLPIKSKLVDCDKDLNGNPTRLVFKVNDGLKEYQLVMSVHGEVLTVYHVHKGVYEMSQKHKHYKRQVNNQYATVLGSRDHELIPQHLRIRHW